MLISGSPADASSKDENIFKTTNSPAANDSFIEAEVIDPEGLDSGDKLEKTHPSHQMTRKVISVNEEINELLPEEITETDLSNNQEENLKDSEINSNLVKNESDLAMKLEKIGKQNF